MMTEAELKKLQDERAECYARVAEIHAALANQELIHRLLHAERRRLAERLNNIDSQAARARRPWIPNPPPLEEWEWHTSAAEWVVVPGPK